jgi:hypothetical protein
MPGGPGTMRSRNVQAAIIERSALGRLRTDELYAERRRNTITNLGSTWLKPPGVSKTLFQLREERREAEEHAEAVRREQLAQELAEAEAAGAQGAGGPGEDLDGDLVMDEEGGARDLDDEIPDADAGGFGFDGASDDDEDEDEDEDDEDEDDEADLDENTPDEELGDDGVMVSHPGQQSRQQRRELASQMATLRETEDRMRRDMMTRERAGNDADFYGEEQDLDEEDQANMIDEDDLVDADLQQEGMEASIDMGMDADLDADIPEAEDGGYEHTDSDASLDTDDEDDQPSAAHFSRPAAGGYRTSLRRSDVTRRSLDINSFLSRDGSSTLGSSPNVPRRP